MKFFDNISLINKVYYNLKETQILGEFIFGGESHNNENEKYKYNVTEYYKVIPLSYNGAIYRDIKFSPIYIIIQINL